MLVLLFSEYSCRLQRACNLLFDVLADFKAHLGLSIQWREEGGKEGGRQEGEVQKEED
jgi:hypothetical protein